jgi:hypothetical protein
VIVTTVIAGVRIANADPTRHCERSEAIHLSLRGATIVPSGVVQLMELQEQGWSYVRP